MHHRKILAVIAASTAAWSFSGPALAFTDSDAREAILTLREELRIWTDTSRRANLQLSQRIDMLEQEITRLRAQVEQLSGPQLGVAGAASDSPALAQDSKEQAAFDGAMNLYRDGNVKEAQESLSAFLTLYPESVLAPTAQFYLGSSLYANKQYSNAISVLNTMAGRFPNHPRAPDALLVIAGSEFELDNRAAAKAALQKIISNYPETVAAQSAKKRLELL